MPDTAFAARRHLMKGSPAFSVGVLQAPVAVLRLFQPCFRVVVVIALEAEFRVVGFGHQEAPLGAFILLVRLDRNVINFPLLEILVRVAASQRDRVKFLTAIPTEMNRVQTLSFAVRVEYLPRARHVALAFGTKGRIQAPRAGDELMELEGEQWFAVSIGHTAQVLRRTEPDQGVPESCRAVFFGNTAISGQFGGGLLARNGARTLGLAIDIL